jgi:ABC-2 type transport system permease protein
MEEKKSRIVEVIISSVKPFQLMFGKIVGTALVGLTQVAIWIILGLVSLTVLQLFFVPEVSPDMGQSFIQGQEQLNTVVSVSPAIQGNKILEVIDMLKTLDLSFILFSFVFYFLGGYLLYSSLFGALGSAVDNDEDIQQLMLPVTFPLILSIVLLTPIVKNPDGSLAFWASIIPFTSPVAMLARIPYGVPVWEFVLSALILVGTTVGAIWIAAKIYKTGILMYGKKVNLKEIIKWLRYKN